MNFNISYFDGQSTRSQAAKLWLRVNSWEIQTIGDEFFPSKTIHWPLDQIHRNETSSQTNTFRFGEFPFQSIECRDANFPQVLMENYPEAQFLNRGYSWLFAQKWKGVVGLSAVLLGLVAVVYFWVLPNLAESLAAKMPQQTEIQLGNYLAEGVMKGLEIDSARSVALQNFSKNIDFQTDYPLQFSVVRSEEINAFALPGGKIVVFDHLLEKIETPEALAGLLAHEVAHVKKRHSLKAMARSLSGGMFISLLFGDVNGLTSVLVENANLIETLGFSRKLEHEADEIALETLAKNRLDQNGMVSLFHTLKSEAEGQSLQGLQFLSSHPLTDERIKFSENAAAGQVNPQKNEELEFAFSQLKSSER